MAKIILNNKEYDIDNAVIASVTNDLKQHLSTTMAGTGATIELDGIAYNIDSVKLSTATNNFVSHLGTISGSGKTITIGGVEFSVDASKVSDALGGLEDAFGELEPVVLALAPGLYQPGAIALCERGNYEAASAMLKTSWDDLEANGVIAISEGVELPDVDLVMNEYGFYFGVPYSMPAEDGTIKLTFNEDGSVVLSQAGEIVELPAGSAIYGDHSIDMISTTGMVFVVSPDGTILDGGEVILSLGILSLPEMNEYGFYYGVPYSTTTNGTIVGLTFNEDGSVIMQENDNITELPPGTAIYGNHTIDMSALDMPVFVVLDDGTSIEGAGLVFSIGGGEAGSEKGTVFVFGEISGDLVLPDTSIYISDEAFRNQTSLTGIYIPGSVKSIGDDAFYDCGNLTCVTIPDSVIRIGASAFGECSSLTYVIIGDSVTVIGASAFSFCTSLSSAVIGKSVTLINTDTFAGCKNLTSIAIPDSVITIGYRAFSGCSSLTSVVIPNSMTKIGDEAFHNCESLTDIIFEGNVDQWSTISFGGRWNQNVPATYIQCSDGQVTL